MKVEGLYINVGGAKSQLLHDQVAKLGQDCTEAADPRPPPTLTADEVEALERFQRTMCRFVHPRPLFCREKFMWVPASPCSCGFFYS